MEDKLPKGWEWKKLGEVSTKISAGGDKPNAFSEFPTNEYKIPVISNGIKNDGIFGYTDKATIFEPCITVSARGTIGYSSIRNQPFLPIVRLISVIPNLELTTLEYIYHSLVYILPKGEGSSIPQLTVPNLKEKKIIFPPLPEQKQIVSILDKAFEKLDQVIALVIENIQKLKQLNESVLDEVFWNLDKEKVKLVSVCEFEPKKAEVKNLFDLDCSFVPMAALNQRKINFYPKEIKKISEVYKGYTYFRDNDVLLAKVTPCFENGKSGVARNLVNGIGFGSSEYYVFRPSEKILSQFIYYFISRESFLIDGAKNMSGAVGLKRVTKTFIENIEISLPSVPEQQRIIKYLDQTTKKNQELTKYYQNKLSALKRLKNSVLDSAFKGELRKEKIISLSQPVIDPYFARTKKFNAKKKADKQAMVIALAIEAHEKVGKSLYRTKGEKTVEILEKHLNIDFGREAEKMTAGPADFKHLVNVVEPLANEKKWFYTQEIKGENYDSHKYIKAENFNPFMMRCVQDLKRNLDEIRRIVNLFSNIKTTHDAEVIATTYTGWNNLIVRKVQIDNEAIVSEARENWHDAKLKIDRQEFFYAIEWLKNHDLIPKGNGREVN